jgi:signal transduction histidine kinase
VFGVDPGIDRLLFPSDVAASANPSRMAPQTSLCLLLVATALLLRQGEMRRRLLGGQVAAVTAGLIALMGIVGRTYGGRAAYHAMAPSTAIAFLILALGVLWSQPERGLMRIVLSHSAAGASARRLLLLAIVILIGLGWLRVLGEQAGLYDSAYGTAAFTIVRISLFMGLILWNAHGLLRAELASSYAAQLEAANTELNAYAYSVSHDLRTPLRSIDGFSRALLEDYAPQLDGKGREHLGRVRAAAQRMAELIDDLLALSQVTRSEMKVGPVDLRALAQAVESDLARAHPARQVEFHVTPNLLVQGDQRLLRLALENLLANAWKFTGKQPRARIEVGVGVDAQDGQRAFFVRDNGAGFDMAHAEKLFGPFQRLHDAREFEGTGIGLATVQRVIRRHGGRVWAHGVPGEGATISFTIP